MFFPDVPLVHALLVVSLVVLADKAIDKLIVRYRRVKKAVDWFTVPIVETGRILPEGLEVHDTGALEVMAMLRLHGIRDLGEVECAFIEPGGAMSMFRADPPRAGLSLIPPPDISDPAPPAPGAAEACCIACGAVEAGPRVLPDGACPFCKNRRWTMPRRAPPAPAS
jgi:hypothetical protein